MNINNTENENLKKTQLLIVRPMVPRYTLRIQNQLLKRPKSFTVINQ